MDRKKDEKVERRQNQRSDYNTTCNKNKKMHTLLLLPFVVVVAFAQEKKKKKKEKRLIAARLLKFQRINGTSTDVTSINDRAVVRRHK